MIAASDTTYECRSARPRVISHNLIAFGTTNAQMATSITCCNCPRRLHAVMSSTQFFSIVFLSILSQTQPLSVRHVANLSDCREHSERGRDTPTTDDRRHSTHRRAVKVNSPNLPSDSVTSTLSTTTLNTQTTAGFTSTHTEQSPTVIHSARSTDLNMLIAADVFTEVSTRSIPTVVGGGYTTPVTAMQLAVNVSTGGNDVMGLFPAPSPVACDTENLDNKTYKNDTCDWSWHCTPSATSEKACISNHTHYVCFKLARAISLYGQPIIASVGVAGNTVSMLVMFQRDNRQTSFGIYLGALAVSDTLTLCTSTALWLAQLLSSSPLMDIDCQMRGWLLNSLQMNGLFLILSVTFDRLISVRFPLKAVVWCDPKRAKIACGVIFGAMWLVNAPFYILNHVETCNVCAIGTPGSVVSLVYPWISAFVGLLVPFVLLVSMNVAIGLAIRSRLPRRALYAPGIGQQTTESIVMGVAHVMTVCPIQNPEQIAPRDDTQLRPMSPRDRNAIVMLFLVSFTFLLLVTPHFVHVAIFSVVDRTSDPSLHADYILFFQVSSKLYSTNNACNFLLYCLSGTKFRSDVVRLFRSASYTP